MSAVAGGTHRPTGALGGVERAGDAAGERLRDEFLLFLESHEAPGAPGERPYALQVSELRREGGTTLYVDYGDVLRHSDVLAAAIAQAYVRFEPFLNAAVAAFVARHAPEYARVAAAKSRTFCAAFHGVGAPLRLRELTTQRVGQLVAVCGTVTRTSEVRPELVRGAFSCDVCGTVVRDVAQQNAYTEPAVCPNGACMNRARWSLIPGASVFADWQRVRVQENADELPPGSMPRALDVLVRGEAAERARAGDRAVFVGSVVAVPDVSQLVRGMPRLERASGRPPADGVTGLRALGVRELSYRLAFAAQTVQPASQAAPGLSLSEAIPDLDEDDPRALFSAAELSEIAEVRSRPDVFARLVSSVAPAIYGHADVKTGLLLMMLGGVHKTTAEGIRLRGDINVCVVGDPGTAKSQLLRAVASLAPRAVYASGKASSAAGLTAAVVRDEETGDFAIEAGALMLADTGVCCIDEFDKMDVRDQVAIHEAMEQQTISIAKAGIHASLNARASVLAAANPADGRYDRRRTLRQNVRLSAPIMSRFDLFFVVLDDGSEAGDYAVARHILGLHRVAVAGADPEHPIAASEPPLSADALRRYIRYARTIRPRLSESAASLLAEQYVALRASDATGAGGAYRMTVRQLESLVRLSEALARAHCDAVVRDAYVREAARLLRASVIRVEADDVALDGCSRAWRAAAADMAAAAAERPAGEDDAPLAVRFDDYARITAAIVGQLRRIESLADIDGPNDDSTPSDLSPSALGMTKEAIVAWYLEQIEDELASEAEYHARARLVAAVVERMAAHDNVLVEIAAPAGDPVLVVHPNYAV